MTCGHPPVWSCAQDNASSHRLRSAAEVSISGSCGYQDRDFRAQARTELTHRLQSACFATLPALPHNTRIATPVWIAQSSIGHPKRSAWRTELSPGDTHHEQVAEQSAGSGTAAHRVDALDGCRSRAWSSDLRPDVNNPAYRAAHIAESDVPPHRKDACCWYSPAAWARRGLNITPEHLRC